MKRIALILLVGFISMIVVSSCNKKECPAYSKAKTEQTGKNV